LKKQNLNISKIAELAGVSKATVSRVLNDYPHISSALREKVMQVVRETGYERNRVAQMLASNRSNMIGLVIPSGAHAIFTDPYFPALTRGITLAAKDNHQTLALFLCESEEEGLTTIKSILKNQLFDGIIITSDHRNNAFETDLANGSMPYVFIGRPQKLDNVSFIDSDNFVGGVVATEYLIKEGYQRIGIIASTKNTSGDDRYYGYVEALEKHNIPLDKSLVAQGDYSMESGTNCMYQLLEAKPDAVFATSDTMALGALRALRTKNIKVPEDIALVGYDDLPPAVQADPPLTTIRQRITQSGELAIETLLQHIENPQRPPRQLSLPIELIVREST